MNGYGKNLADGIVFYLDVDGPLADLHTPWLKWYNANWSDNLQLEDIKTWHFHDFVKPECGQRIYEFLRHGFIYDLIDPVPGALEAVESIRAFLGEAGNVVFATACNVHQGYSKFKWLARHGFLPNDKYESLKYYVEVRDKSILNPQNAILVDDAVHNVVGFQGYSLVFDMPWNRDAPPAYKRIMGWDGFKVGAGVVVLG